MVPVKAHQGFSAYEANTILEENKKRIHQKVLLLTTKISSTALRSFRYVSCGHETETDEECKCNRYCGIVHPLLWGAGLGGGFFAGMFSGISNGSFEIGLSVGLGIPIVSVLTAFAIGSVRYCVDKTAQIKRLNGYRDQLGAIETMQRRLPFEETAELFDVDKGGTVIRFLGDKELEKLNLQQLYLFYQKAPEKFWSAFNRQVIAVEERLIIYKFNQLAQADAESLLEALEEEDTSALLTKNSYILKCLIQKISKTVWDDSRVRQSLRNCLKNESEKGLELIRKGKCIEVVSDNEVKISFPTVNLVIDQDTIEVNRLWLIANSAFFRKMLTGEFKEKSSDQIHLFETDSASLRLIIECLKEEKPLDISLKNWMSLWNTADKYAFPESIKNLESWAVLNLEEITSQAFESFAGFFNDRKLTLLLRRLDLFYREKIQKESSMTLNRYRDILESTRSLHLTHTRIWLLEHLKEKVLAWLKEETNAITSTIAASKELLEYLKVWEYVPEGDIQQIELVKEILLWIELRVKNEAAQQTPKLLAYLWTLANQHKCDLMKKIVIKFCKEPSHYYFRQIAWVSLPLELRAALIKA